MDAPSAQCMGTPRRSPASKLNEDLLLPPARRFTNVPFGDPLAVFTDARGSRRDDAGIARSEPLQTTFVLPARDRTTIGCVFTPLAEPPPAVCRRWSSVRSRSKSAFIEQASRVVFEEQTGYLRHDGSADAHDQQPLDVRPCTESATRSRRCSVSRRRRLCRAACRADVSCGVHVSVGTWSISRRCSASASWTSGSACSAFASPRQPFTLQCGLRVVGIAVRARPRGARTLPRRRRRATGELLAVEYSRARAARDSANKHRVGAQLHPRDDRNAGEDQIAARRTVCGSR